MSPNSSQCKVVALDAMGVLYESADDVSELLIPYARAHGSRLAQDRLEQIYVECSLGRMTSAQFWAELGAAGAQDEEYCLGHALIDGVLPALERLSARGVRLACLSNDVSEWSLLLRRRFGLDKYLTTWVISGDIGFRKPSPEAYSSLLRAVDVDPSRILFVDDRMVNVRAARAAGLASVLYGASVPDLDGDGQRTVRRMDSVEDLLD
jgi:HAD superfamily hydrolase (TIGR01509 family)